MLSILQGFTLQDRDVDEVLRAGRDIYSCILRPDPALTPEDNVDVLMRVCFCLLRTTIIAYS